RPGVPRSRRVVQRVLRRVPHVDRDPAMVPQLDRARAARRVPSHLAARRLVGPAANRGLRPRDLDRQPGRDRRRGRRTPGCAARAPGGTDPRRSAEKRSVPGVRVPDLDRADVRGMESNWRKSSYSGDNGGECVEVASAETVLVRDTTDRNGPVLTFTADAWRSFTATIR